MTATGLFTAGGLNQDNYGCINALGGFRLFEKTNNGGLGRFTMHDNSKVIVPVGQAFTVQSSTTLDGVDDDGNNANNGCISVSGSVSNSGTITGEFYLNDADGVVPGTVGPNVTLGTGDCGGGCVAAPPCTTPTATAAATQPTCVGAGSPNNGTITINGFTAGQRYQYSSGATFNSGAATPATITAIPVGGVITSTLPNTTQQYTVRIYDATDDACFVDRVVSMTAAACCSVTINSSTPSACVPATNTYSLTVNVSWANASGTTLTVTTTAPGATPQTITTTLGSSGTQSVTFTGLTANAMMYNVTAQFDAGCTATTTNAFTAPPACTGCGTPGCGSTMFLKRT